jgi:hypothetical protein
MNHCARNGVSDRRLSGFAKGILFFLGFHHRPLSGYPAGFPVLMENKLSMIRAIQMLLALGDGNYVDKKVRKPLSGGERLIKCRNLY